MSDTVVDGILRRLYDEIKVEVEKEVYGLTAGRGKDMKVKVDRLEGEVESLHSVIKLKDERLDWWRELCEGNNGTIAGLRVKVGELEKIISERNSAINSLQGRLNALTIPPPSTDSIKWEYKNIDGKSQLVNVSVV